MTPEQEKVLEILRKVGGYILDDYAEKHMREIDAIYNPPPTPSRDHNSLKVTENTPSGTLVRCWNDGYDNRPLRYLSHIDNGKFCCFYDGLNSGITYQWEHAERYIGQHFIPWDAKQSDGMLPCGGVVAITTRNGVMRTDQADSLMWSRITGYLHITDDGEIDWERVPR